MSYTPKRGASRYDYTGSAPKNQQKKIVFIAVAVLLVIALTAVVVMIVSGINSSGHTEGKRHDVTVAKNGGSDAAAFTGTWILDSITSYEFDGAGRGVMHTAKDFPFAYSADNGELNIDFDSDDGRDCKYDYTIDGVILTLKRSDSSYVLTKQVK